MKVFIVNSDIAPGEMDSIAWVRGIPKMFTESKIENVKFKTAYCCTPDKKMIGEFHADDKETLRSGLTKIGFPFAEIHEVTTIV
jgi:hypothetical protein